MEGRQVFELVCSNDLATSLVETCTMQLQQLPDTWKYTLYTMITSFRRNVPNRRVSLRNAPKDSYVGSSSHWSKEEKSMNTWIINLESQIKLKLCKLQRQNFCTVQGMFKTFLRYKKLMTIIVKKSHACIRVWEYENWTWNLCYILWAVALSSFKKREQLTDYLLFVCKRARQLLLSSPDNLHSTMPAVTFYR